MLNITIDKVCIQLFIGYVYECMNIHGMCMSILEYVHEYIWYVYEYIWSMCMSI